MKRLLSAFVAGSFLTLAGLQSLHAHSASVPESCSVCALGQQSVRDVPAAAPSVEPVLSHRMVVGAVDDAAEPVYRSPAQARGPPSLS